MPRHRQRRAELAFTNKENDYPVSQKPAYGVAGWTKDDHSVIVYDTIRFVGTVSRMVPANRGA